MKKANATVDRDIIWKIMEKLQIMNKLLKISNSSFKKVIEIMDGRKSKEFVMNRRMKQGNGLHQVFFLY